MTNDPVDLPAPPGSPPPSPPPSSPNSDGEEEDDEPGEGNIDPEARNGLPAQSKSEAMTPAQRKRQLEDERNKDARVIARQSPAMLPRLRSTAGSSSGVGASKRPKANPGAPSSRDESNSGADGTESVAAGGEAGAAVGETAEGDGEAAGGEAEAAGGDGEVAVGEAEAAGGEAEEEAEADEADGEEEGRDEGEGAEAADESITPEKGQKALLAAVRLYDPKSKVENLPFTPLIAATRATDFGPTLTASSSDDDIKTACESLASKLGSLKKPGDLRKQALNLMSMLEFPSPLLLDAFSKQLRAGEGCAAGGAAAQAMEALLTARRKDIARLVIAPTEATGKNACAKIKELFRHIRTVYPNVLTELEP